MKIAITSKGNTPDSLVDSRFGRCEFFAIYDTEDDKLRFVENPNRDAASGAGPASVVLIAREGVQKVVCAEFGMKVKKQMEDLDIQPVIMKDEKTVDEIVKLIR